MAAASGLNVLERSCCVALGQTPAALDKAYTAYVSAKHARDEEPRGFQDYLAFLALRDVKDFAFSNAGLVFKLIKGAEEVEGITIDNFVKFAPRLGALASWWDAETIFDVLATPMASAALAPSATAAERRRVSHILMPSFLAYVERMKETVLGEASEFKAARPALGLDSTERLVFSESNVVDNSSLPPLKGTVFVSTRHVAFESALIKKRKIFSHAELRSVAKGGASQILRQDNAIVLHALLEGAEAELKWEFGGIISSFESKTQARDAFLYYLEFWRTVHRLVAKVDASPRARDYLLRSVLAAVPRMRALERVEPSKRSARSPRYCDALFGEADAERLVFLDALKRHAQERKLAEPDTSSLLSVEATKAAMRLLTDEAAGKVQPLDDPEADDTVLEMAASERAREEKTAAKQEFSLALFSVNLQVLKSELSIFSDVSQIAQSVIMWQQPLLTGAVLLLLVDIGLRDKLHLLPGLLLFFHTLLLGALKVAPELVFRALGIPAPAALSARTASAEDMTDWEVLREDAADEAQGPGAIVAPPAGGSGIAIVDKIRDYRGRAAEATATLLRLQNWLHDANISVMRFKGLYEWRNVRATHAFFLLSLAATLVLLLVPQRIVFLAFLAWLFTIRWRTSPSPIELLLVQVPLPKSFISRIERVKKE